MKFNKCVWVHDAKPDYELINSENSDSNVNPIWERFSKYGLKPRSADSITRIGFHGKCDPNRVNIVAGCRASDLSSSMLAGFFFPETNEQLQFEGFVSAANSLAKPYSLDDILDVVQNRMGPNIDPRERVHTSTGYTILRKIQARKEEMPWLDARVRPFNFIAGEGRFLVIHRWTIHLMPCSCPTFCTFAKRSAVPERE